MQYFHGKVLRILDIVVLTLVFRFNLVNHPYHGDFADRYKKEGSTEPPKE
jgi:hypothetical protein